MILRLGYQLLEWLMLPFLKVLIYPNWTTDRDHFSIGVMEVNRLGDLELILPAINNLRARLPSATIVLIGATALLDLARDHSSIDEFLSLDVPWMNHDGKYNVFNYGPFWKQLMALRRRKLDACLDTRGDLRRHFVMALAGIPERVSYDRFTGGLDLGYKGRLLSHVIRHPQLSMQRAEENNYFIDRWLSSGATNTVLQLHPLRPWPSDRALRIALHIESHWPNKMWKEEKWLLVMETLTQHYNVQFFFLSPDPSTAAAFIHKAAARSLKVDPLCVPLRQLRQRLSSIDLYLGVDSGPMHVADAQGCRVRAIFGPSDIALWHAYNNGLSSVIARQDTCPYAPCGKPDCRTGDTRCMRDVSVEDVISACAKLFASEIAQNLASPREGRL